MIMLSQFSGAVMDEGRKHRFLLWRFWDDRPRMLFIGLNPSTANEMEDDPTIRRLCDFAKRWGYGGLYACNLFSYVTPYPAELTPGNALHFANEPAIQMAAKLSALRLVAWGDGIERVPYGKDRATIVLGTLEIPQCFGLTMSGNPKHPLYLGKDSTLVDYWKTSLSENDAVNLSGYSKMGGGK